ncbi:MAG: hypothetical protein KDD70_18455 [Bdellovibrionales bacterium]|nr:hypothetical protein [Bdellovibrionales bacterium]
MLAKSTLTTTALRLCFLARLCFLVIGVVLTRPVGGVAAAHAEGKAELKKIFSEVMQLVEEGNVTKAANKLNVAQNLVQDIKNEGLKSYFPDTVSGLTGEKIDISSALGLTNLTRKYAGDGVIVAISLVGGGSNGGALGGIAGLGRLAAMMQQGKGKQKEIQGFSARLDDAGAFPELTVFLESGAIIKIEGKENANLEKLEKFALDLKLKPLDKYLTGDALPGHSVPASALSVNAASSAKAPPAGVNNGGGNRINNDDANKKNTAE